MLTGVPAGQTCFATGVSGATAGARRRAQRKIVTWNGTKGIPFEWASLTAAQQTALDTGDAAPINANRLNYLRGDRTNEQNAMGGGLFGARDSVLADIVDSSPTPVGPPTSPYPPKWSDFLISSPSLPENAGQSYPSYALAQQSATEHRVRGRQRRLAARLPVRLVRRQRQLRQWRQHARTMAMKCWRTCPARCYRVRPPAPAAAASI